MLERELSPEGSVLVEEGLLTKTVILSIENRLHIPSLHDTVRDDTDAEQDGDNDAHNNKNVGLCFRFGHLGEIGCLLYGALLLCCLFRAKELQRLVRVAFLG